MSLYKQSSGDFSRSSALSFEVVVGSILNLFKESVEFNLQNILPSLSVRAVTGSAFSQARYKVKPEVFRDLLEFFKEPYCGLEKKLWKGHILLAGDGSTLNLPASKDIEAYFGVHSVNQLGTKRYLARALLIYDVLNNFIVSGHISSMKTGEKNLLREWLSTALINDNHILILDRGFGNFCTFKELLGKGMKFCVRLPTNNSNFAKRVIDDEREDFITRWEPSPKERENSRSNQLDCVPIQVRVIKVRLTTGETEILVTNLSDQQKYTSKDMADLYKLRWGVEEGFKNLKPKMKIEQFGCKKAAGIFQEFYAHIFCINMVSLTGIVANKLIEKRTRHRKWKYKYNWKNAYRFIREKLIEFLFCKATSTLLDKWLKQISSSIVPEKPDRHFPRDTRSSNRKGRITQFNK
ncbi:IS4 family transposase [Fulvivirga marina]|uniref:IS4 family transposase n=1 Tax=Fulvivirga marina TaxID=2494733 RepID=UPI00293D9640|nr:IS4 family transposase [Fulvivirga marina]